LPELGFTGWKDHWIPKIFYTYFFHTPGFCLDMKIKKAASIYTDAAFLIFNLQSSIFKHQLPTPLPPGFARGL
jgi:hypothetical protein